MFNKLVKKLFSQNNIFAWWCQGYWFIYDAKKENKFLHDEFKYGFNLWKISIDFNG